MDEQELIPTGWSRKKRTTIHRYRLAGDKVVLDQEQDRLRDVVAGPDATDRDVGAWISIEDGMHGMDELRDSVGF